MYTRTGCLRQWNVSSLSRCPHFRPSWLEDSTVALNSHQVAMELLLARNYDHLPNTLYSLQTLKSRHLIKKDTSIYRTHLAVPNTLIVYIATPEIRTPHWLGHFLLSQKVSRLNMFPCDVILERRYHDINQPHRWQDLYPAYADLCSYHRSEYRYALGNMRTYS